MHRHRHAVLAIVLAVLVTTAVPVQVAGTGATNTATMQHTSATDFQAGTTTGAAAVTGSGQPADVHVPNTIDNYDDNDITEYFHDTANFSTQSTTVADGTHALNGTQADSGNPTHLYSTSGLDRYPQQGDTFSARLYLTGTTDKPGLRFGVQDHDNLYQVFLNDDNDSLRLQVKSGGGFTALDSMSTGDMPTNEWLTVTVDWATDGTITATLEDASGSTLGTVTGSDTTFTSGGIGVQAHSSGTSTQYFDTVQLSQDTTTTGTYTSSAHDVTNPDSAWTDLSLDAASATVTWEYHDGSNWLTHDTTVHTSGGNQTVDTSTQAADKWRTSVELTHFEHNLSSVWHFDDGSGDTATDSYGTRDATLVNNPEWNTTAKVGSHSIDLIEGGRGVLGTGDSDYVSVPNKSSPREEFTYSIWVYPHLDTTDRTIVGASKSEDPDNIVLVREDTGEAGAFIPNVSSSRLTGGNIPLDAWTHVAIVYTGSEERLYVNGTLVNSRSANGNVTEFGDILIGRSDTGDTGNNFDGLVDHPMSHGRALTTEELQYHYNNPTSYEGGTAELHDEGLEFENHAPDASNVSPSDGTTTEYEDVTFSADISDTEFTDAEGDTVTVDLVVDGTVRDTQTLTSAGSYSKTLTLADGTYNWHLELTDDWGGTTTTTSQTVTVSHSAPELDNTSASPQGNPTLDTTSQTLEINVTDEDFPKDGDSVTVEFRNASDDSVIGTDTRTSNGTASTTWSSLDGGQHDWYAVATDDYGYSDTSDTFTFSTPNELRIYNESRPNDLVDETNVEITVRFYQQDSDTVDERSTTTGKIDMSGLPVGEEFVVVARAEGYHDRRIVIDSLVDQQDVFLLPETEDSVSQRFYLDDRTGQFQPEDTRLYVERALTRDWNNDGTNTTEFTVISGDYFGAAESFPVVLREDQRYRLRLENQNGDTRILGSHTADAAGDVELRVGERIIEIGPDTETYDWGAFRPEDSDTLKFEFVDPETNTTNLELKIYERGNKTNELHNGTYSGPFGDFTVSESLTGSQQNTTWVAAWQADRNGETIEGKRVFGTGTGDPGIPLDGLWRETAAFGLVLVTGGLFGGIRAELGAVVVSLMAGVLWYIQWLPSAVGGSVVFLAIAVAALMAVTKRGGGGF